MVFVGPIEQINVWKANVSVPLPTYIILAKIILQFSNLQNFLLLYVVDTFSPVNNFFKAFVCRYGIFNQINVAKHEKNILGAIFCIFRCTITPKVT